MSVPGVELRWGHGFIDKPRNREVVRPFVNEALELAKEGIYDLGLEFGDRKYVVIDKSASNPKFRGEAGGKTSHIYIKPEELRRRYIDTVWMSAYMVHELVHLVHDEYLELVEDKDMLVYAAAEGIAQIAQHNFANEVLHRNGRRGPPYRIVEKILSLPKREKSRLEFEFWKASAKPDSRSEQNHYEWFHRFAPPLRFPRGATVGVIAVARHMSQGRDIAELVTLPPEDVLDVA